MSLFEMDTSPTIPSLRDCLPSCRTCFSLECDNAEVCTSDPRSGRTRLLQRVIRASLPIQGLMLILLGIASLFPVCEDEWGCVLSNNLEDSFTPMLRYVNGQPPT